MCKAPGVMQQSIEAVMSKKPDLQKQYEQIVEDTLMGQPVNHQKFKDFTRAVVEECCDTVSDFRGGATDPIILRIRSKIHRTFEWLYK